MLTPPSELKIEFPESILRFNERWAGKIVRGIERQMHLAIESALTHIQQVGCGPFFSIISEIETDKILCGAGNLVVYGSQSWMHGERLAFALGQKTLNQFMFPKGKYRLVTTAAMCVGCYGESLGTGISEIVAAARGSDVESLTIFREGKLPSEWREELRKLGINYIEDLLRNESFEPLKAYSGPNYFNAGSGS